jgi:hypothetical protein
MVYRDLTDDSENPDKTTLVFADKLAGLLDSADLFELKETPLSSLHALFVLSGAGAPASTPVRVGQLYIDTTNFALFVATGTASAADWKIATPTLSGSGAPASTPARVGQFYIDTTNFVLYVATGTASAADWKRSSGPRLVTVTAGATPAINTDLGNLFTISALGAAITSMTTNLTGTPFDGQIMEVRILDDGTARAITWGASFASGPGTLPTTTILSKWLYVAFQYSSSRSKWMCMAAGSEQ